MEPEVERGTRAPLLSQAPQHDSPDERARCCELAALEFDAEGDVIHAAECRQREALIPKQWNFYMDMSLELTDQGEREDTLIWGPE